jgi:hypothetical protein
VDKKIFSVPGRKDKIIIAEWKIMNYGICHYIQPKINQICSSIVNCIFFCFKHLLTDYVIFWFDRIFNINDILKTISNKIHIYVYNHYICSVSKLPLCKSYRLQQLCKQYHRQWFNEIVLGITTEKNIRKPSISVIIILWTAVSKNIITKYL